MADENPHPVVQYCILTNSLNPLTKLQHKLQYKNPFNKNSKHHRLSHPEPTIQQANLR
jgi:hypothetical protein